MLFLLQVAVAVADKVAEFSERHAVIEVPQWFVPQFIGRKGAAIARFRARHKGVRSVDVDRACVTLQGLASPSSPGRVRQPRRALVT